MNIKIFLFDKRNMRGKGIVNIIDDIDDKFVISTRIRDHIFNEDGMSLFAAVTSDSCNNNTMCSVEEIDISFMGAVKVPGMTVALRTFNFIEIYRIDDIIIGILSKVLDFFV